MGTIKKKCKVIRLETYMGQGSIFKSTISGDLVVNFYEKIVWKDCKYYHLYITSDDEIKEDDWVFIPHLKQRIQNKYGKIGSVVGDDIYLNKNCFKIIATTDKSLSQVSKKEIPQPSKSFIQKYCEQGGIDEVMVEYEQVNINKSMPPYARYIYQPKISPDNTITISKVKDSWTRDEVESILFNCLNDQFAIESNKSDIKNLERWIEDNL